MDKIISPQKKENINFFLDSVLEKLHKEDVTFTNIKLNTSKDSVENINDIRIKRNILLANILNRYNSSLTYIDFNNLIQIDINDEECTEYESVLLFWRSITKKVEKKEVLNFPMCVLVQYFCKSILNKEFKKYCLTFVKYPEINTKHLVFKDQLKENVFQKLMIFYILDTYYNLSADLFIFEKISNFNNKPYTYKIKDLVFTIFVKDIIILSPKTKLINKKLNICDYLNLLTEEEKNIINSNKTYNNFYELFIENFITFFEKKIFNTKNIRQVMELSCESISVVPGHIYIYSNSNLSMPVYVLILSENETHIKFLILLDSTIQKSLSMMIKVVNKNLLLHKFYYPDLIYESSNFTYTIGFN